MGAPSQLPRAGEADVLNPLPLAAAGLAMLLLGGAAMVWSPMFARSRRG